MLHPFTSPARGRSLDGMMSDSEKARRAITLTMDPVYSGLCEMVLQIEHEIQRQTRAQNFEMRARLSDMQAILVEARVDIQRHSDDAWKLVGKMREAAAKGEP